MQSVFFQTYFFRIQQKYAVRAGKMLMNGANSLKKFRPYHGDITNNLEPQKPAINRRNMQFSSKNWDG